LRLNIANCRADLTQRLILDAAVDLLETTSASKLSVRAVAKRAEISERTVFRYFAAREDLLDAWAVEVARRTQAPPNPNTVAELLAYPEAIFARYEETSALTLAAMHSELFHRIRTTDAENRGRRSAPWSTARPPAGRGASGGSRLPISTTTWLPAPSTWRHFRFYFGFPLEDAAACARMAIRQTLAGLGINVDAA